MSKRLTNKEFIERACQVHGDKYDYTLVDYRGCNYTINIICRMHGQFSQRADKHLANHEGCKECKRIALTKTGKWTNEFILEEIKRISKNDIPISSKNVPTLSTMANRRFGSWSNACKAAGVLCRRRGVPTYEICSIPLCNNKVRSPHCPWCEMHYYRNRRNGDPEKLFTKQYTVDESVFDTWTDSSAWLIGLLWTDGWMTKHYDIGLQLKDVQLIETAKQELHTNVKIQTITDFKGREYKRFQIANTHIVNRLRELGMHHSKTFTIEYPKGMPNELFGSFFRGVIDGDGSVLYGHRRKNSQVKDCRVSMVSASPLFVDQLKDKLLTHNISFSVAVRSKYLKDGVTVTKNWKSNHHDIWRITICEHQSLRKLYEIMYPTSDVPCLHRKRDSYTQYYNTPRIKAGNPNYRIGFWDDLSKTEDLKKMYTNPSITRNEMEKHFGCPWSTIKFGGHQLKLCRPCYWTPSEDNILQEHYPKSSWNLLFQLLPNRNKSGIHQRAWKLGINRC